MLPMSERRQLLAGVRVVSLGTLASRVLGLVRDMVTAALLGMSAGGVMDAFVVAFRVPNLFRRLFGEGALTASYLPQFAAQWENDRRAAWQLASVAGLRLAGMLFALVLIGEGVCALLWLTLGDRPGMPLVLGLSATMLPYSILICLAALAIATLHALGEFRLPALAPILLNLMWIAAAVWIAPVYVGDPQAQAFVLAVTVLVAGFVQLGVQWPALRHFGFRFDYNPTAVRQQMRQIVAAMAPMLLGLAVTQINTLMDSLIAWGLSSSPEESGAVWWLGGAVDYPMRQGAASAVYYGERMYQFPLALLGLAVATAIFPLLSRHAARRQFDRLAADLGFGLRLVLFLAIPATVGLVLLAEPLTVLLFQRGQWDAATDTPRTAQMISAYALGVWAYCALPVVVRGYYAVGDYRTPVRVGLGIVALNFVLSAALIWPLAEAGLAVATAVAAVVQVVVLLGLFSRQVGNVSWRSVLATALRTTVAAALMGGVLLLVERPLGEIAGLAGKIGRVVVPLVLSAAVFFPVTWLLGARELGQLLGRKVEEEL